MINDNGPDLGGLYLISEDYRYNCHPLALPRAKCSIRKAKAALKKLPTGNQGLTQKISDLISLSRSFSTDGHVSRRVRRVLEVLLPVDGLGVRHLSLDAVWMGKTDHYFH